jgi:anti-sigma regulatory factor (Ser/Thr protein kinase)
MTDTHGPIEIRVPADPHLSRVLRLAASGIASLGDFSVDEMEDIKVAVSEILLSLIEHGDGAAVEVRLEAPDNRFVIQASTPAAHFDTAHPNLVMSTTVLSGVCSSYEISHHAGRATISAIVTHDGPAVG